MIRTRYGLDTNKLRTNADECVQSGFLNFSQFGCESCRYNTDSYELGAFDTDPLRIERIDTDGPSVASVEYV